jgi:hypothetical protein
LWRLPEIEVMSGELGSWFCAMGILVWESELRMRWLEFSMVLAMRFPLVSRFLENQSRE